MIPTPPNTFSVRPYAEQWFAWVDVALCFWPGVGKRSSRVNPFLAPIVGRAGVYLLAWSKAPPAILGPRESSVVYVGETNWFKGRMGDFANSAGFRGARRRGHSAAWRWPEGRTESLWLAFFETPGAEADLPAHLAVGWRKWMEAVAIEEYRQANGGAAPALNTSSDGAIALD